MAEIYPVIEAMLRWLFEVSLHAGVLVVLVLAIRGALGKWLTARWRYALWGLVVARLIVPVLPGSDFSALNLLAMGEGEMIVVDASVGAAGAGLMDEDWVIDGGEEVESFVGVAEGAGVGLVEESEISSVDDSASAGAGAGVGVVVGLIWLVGVLVIGGWVLIGHVRFLGKVRRGGVEVEGEAGALLGACMDEMGMKRGRVVLVETDAVGGPALMGVLKPRILVPGHLLESLSREELRFVLLHELAHDRCKDVAANWMLLVLSAVHWFNPLIWFGFYRLRCDREALRDAMVLECGEVSESRAYGLALVRVLERGQRLGVCPTLVGGAGVVGSRGEMERRVRLIAEFGGKVRRWKQVLGVGVVVVLGCVGLTGAKVDGVLFDEVLKGEVRMYHEPFVKPMAEMPESGLLVAEGFLRENAGRLEDWVKHGGDKAALLRRSNGYLVKASAGVHEELVAFLKILNGPNRYGIEIEYQILRCDDRPAGMEGKFVDDQPEAWAEVVGGYQTVVASSRARFVNGLEIALLDGGGLGVPSLGVGGTVSLKSGTDVDPKYITVTIKQEEEGEEAEVIEDVAYSVPSGGRVLIPMGAGDSDLVLAMKATVYERGEGVDLASSEKHAVASGVLTSSAGSIEPLVGKLAPELVGIVGWRNSEPLQLKDLRGRYVLLQFWGLMQPVRRMMALSEMFSRDDLAMIAVHGASIGSLEELDERLGVVGEKFLMGRGVDYPIALDGAGGVGEEVEEGVGATFRAYGLTYSPMTVLIDPEGIVLGRFHASSLGGMVVGLEKLLGVQAKKPGWRKRFEAVYGLEGDEVLRYVAEPYVEERKDFYYGEYTRWGWLSSRRSENYPTDEPKSSMFRWSGEGGRIRGDMSPGRYRIRDVLFEFGYDDRDFENTDGVMAQVIAGDWVMREGADRAELLDAFETILNDELEMSIRFEWIEVEHDVYVATGAFKYVSLGGAYEKKQIHMYTTEPDPADEIRGGGGSGDVSHMLDYAGRLGGVRIENQATSNLEEELFYRQHSSTRGLRNQADSAAFEQLLESIGKQTGLTFKKVGGEGVVLRVVEVE